MRLTSLPRAAHRLDLSPPGRPGAGGAVSRERKPGDLGVQILLFALFYGCLMFVVLVATRRLGIGGVISPTVALGVGAFFLLIGRAITASTLAITVAALVVHLLLGDSLVLSICLALAGALGFALVAWGCVRTGVEREVLLSVPMVISLAVVAVAGTFPGSLLAAAALVFEGAGDLSHLFLRFWIPQMASVMLLLPPFLLWHSRDEAIEGGGTPAWEGVFSHMDGGAQEATLAAGALAGSVAAAYVFQELLLLDIGVCVLLWFAFRLGVFPTALAASAFAVVTIGLQLAHAWPARDGMGAELLKLQGRLVFATFPALLIGALMAQRERQRRELQEDQRRLAYALDGANDGIWDWHLPTDAIFFSAGAYRMLGYEPVTTERALAEFRALVHPDDMPTLRQAFRDHAEARRPLCQAELRARHRNGDYVWLLHRGKIVERDSEGRPVRAVGTLTDISQRKHLEAALEHAASHDPLTGLANRTTFNRTLEQARRRLARDGALFAVLLVDLDHFKSVNDRHGHMTGDLLLTTTARRLQSAIRAGDLVARFGGDEFAVIAAGKTMEEFAALADRLHKLLSLPVEADGLALPVSVSIGMAVAGVPEIDPAHLVAEADAALYAVKNGGRAGWRAAPCPEPADTPAPRSGTEG